MSDERARGVGVGVGAPDDVLEVEQPTGVVAAVPDDGDPGEPGAQEERHRLAQRLVLGDGHHVGPRHHHLAHDGVAELEDRVDHLALVVLDDVGLPRPVEQVAQLGLALERSLAVSLAGGHGVAEGHEDVGDRPEHLAQAHRERRGPQGHRVVVLAPEGARRDTDDDERDERHDRDGDEEAGGRAVDEVEDGDRDEDRAHRLRDDAQEGEHREVCRGVADHDQQRRRAAAAVVVQLLGAHPRHPDDGRLGCREEKGHDDAQQRERHHLGDHVCLRWSAGRDRRGRSAAAGAAARTSPAPRPARRGRSRAGAAGRGS